MPARAACVLGAYEGIAVADARTSARLVCQALQDAGADVATEPVARASVSAGSPAYVVGVHPLGYVVVLEVAYEAPVGTREQARTLQLNGIEEVAVAAPRIADSLVHGTPLAQTAKLHSLVGQETRPYQKEYGETKFALGVLGFALPDDTYGGFGAFGRVYYEAARYAVGVDLRVGGSSSGNGDASLVGISVGARYFLNEADISPFVGGGVGILWLGAQRRYDAPASSSVRYDYFTLDGSGMGAFGELGVEFLRLHGSRLDAMVRVDTPFFTLHDSGDGHEHYALPISLMASYSFD